MSYSKFLDEIFELPPNHRVRQALDEEGFERISDLIGLSHQEIEELPISPVFVRRFKKLVDWYENHDNPTVALWFTLTSDMYASYIPSYTASKPPSVVTSQTASIPIPDVAVSGAHPSAPRQQHIPSVLPGVKRMISDFPKLTNDENWCIFKRLF